MKIFVLLGALFCLFLGRGYITINTERFTEIMNNVIENSAIRNLGRKYTRNRYN